MSHNDGNSNNQLHEKEVRVELKKIIDKIDLPISIRFATLPSENTETMFVATQVGEIIAINNNKARVFLDIRDRVIKLGIKKSAYDERGLLGMAFHPDFSVNGKLYLYYSQKGSEGCNPCYEPVNPCNPSSLKQEWNRSDYDHVDVLEEWVYNQSSSICQYNYQLLAISQPFFNNNGKDNLIFGPDNSLLLGLGDGGGDLDPFNLAQDDDCVLGKLLSIDLTQVKQCDTYPISYLSELPSDVRKAITVLVKGVRNTSHPSFDNSLSYLPNNGNSIESVYSFDTNNKDQKKNLGWRAWDGLIPTTIEESCNTNEEEPRVVIIWDYDGFPKTGEGLTIKIREGDTVGFISNDDYEHGVVLADSNWRVAGRSKTKYYLSPSKQLQGKLKFNDVGEYCLVDPHCSNRLKLKVIVLANHNRKDDKTVQDCIVYMKESLYMKDRYLPLATLHHRNMNKSTNEITGGEVYKGDNINNLKNKYIFSDLSERNLPSGSLFYISDKAVHKIIVDHKFKSDKHFYVSLGANQDGTKLYLGVYESLGVNNYKLGSVYEVLPSTYVPSESSHEPTHSKCSSSNDSECSSSHESSSNTKYTSGESETSTNSNKHDYSSFSESCPSIMSSLTVSEFTDCNCYNLSSLTVSESETTCEAILKLNEQVLVSQREKLSKRFGSLNLLNKLDSQADKTNNKKDKADDESCSSYSLE